MSMFPCCLDLGNIADVEVNVIAPCGSETMLCIVAGMMPLKLQIVLYINANARKQYNLGV